MTTEIINDLIPIPCTDREKLLKLRSLLIEIQSTWFDNLFDSGLTFADPIVWEKMIQAVCLMERRDNPSAKGFDLKTIASDYKLLEQIFIASEWSADQFLLNSDDFKACNLVRVHHFSAIRILKEVQAFIAKRSNPLPMGVNAARDIPDEDTAYEIISKGIIDDE
jgi:hypothetical protein